MDELAWAAIGGVGAIAAVLIATYEIAQRSRIRSATSIGTECSPGPGEDLQLLRVIAVGDRTLYDLRASVLTPDAAAAAKEGVWTCWSLRHGDAPWEINFSDAPTALIEISWLDTFRPREWRTGVRIDASGVCQVYSRGRWYPARENSGRSIRALRDGGDAGLQPLPSFGPWFAQRRWVLRARIFVAVAKESLRLLVGR